LHFAISQSIKRATVNIIKYQILVHCTLYKDLAWPEKLYHDAVHGQERNKQLHKQGKRLNEMETENSWQTVNLIYSRKQHSTVENYKVKYRYGVL